MTQPNPRLIELARLSRGYTQKELASLLTNLNQSNLSKVEKGILQVSDETLQNISDVLKYPIDFFYQEELKTPFSNIYFRKRTTIPQRFLDKIFTDVKIILKSIDYLLADIELKEYEKYMFDLTNEGWTPEAIAVRMREVMKIPAGPVKFIVTKLEEEGIIVYFYDSPHEKFDGLTSYTDNGYPVIVVNKKMPNDRIRFTLAHEFFHLIAHIPCDVEPWRDVEMEANNFASEFLMPEKDCYNELITVSYPNLTILKAYWGVSKAAIIRRAKTLGVINESSYKYLMIELGRRNERKNETGYVELEEPKIIAKVIDLLKNELHQTKEDLAESIYLRIDDYERYFENSSVVKIRQLRAAI
jgi:Zn-dependent peptidase ImmA (M78 family)/DNA-binding XRE family transcriptional regulator